MKYLLAVFIVIVCFAETEIFAQLKQREFITTEIIIKRERYSRKIKVPLSEKPFSEDKIFFNEGEYFVEDTVIDHCTNCPPLSSEIYIFAFAIPFRIDMSKLTIWVSFRNKRKCGVKEKEILVKRGENSEINLKCGVKIIAYY
jgi:hypothetical protein